MNKDNPYNELCPDCHTPATSRCRCRLGNFNCKNGHSWHYCPEHKCCNPGTGHGSGGGCTCNEKEAAAKPNWIRHVMENYTSTTPPQGIFTRSPQEIVDAGDVEGVAPYGVTSWQRMVNFHRNRSGRNLTPERRQALTDAITLLSRRIKERKGLPEQYDPKTLLPLKRAVAAKGIPDRGVYGDLSKLPVGQLLNYVVQHHKADRAGPHYDVRLGNEDTGLYSWASRKGIPQKGEKRLAVQQPLHDAAYGSFAGTIPEGYGKGTVSLHDTGKALITKVEPDKIHFTLAHRRYPERFVLVKPKGGIGQKEQNWLLMNTTPVDPLKYPKLKYKSVPADKIQPLLDNLKPGSSVQAKIDGAHTLTQVLKDKIELLSYRQSKVHGGPIVHTERVFRTIPNVEVPKQYQGSVMSGELYGTQKGQALDPQALGGLLNSSLAKSIPAQDQLGMQFKNQLFDLRRLGKKDVTTDTPYETRMGHLRTILQSIGGPDASKVQDVYHLPEEAKTPATANKLYQDVAAGKHPGTTEGIVIHPPTGTPVKSKLFDEHDVHIRGFFPGKGKYTDQGVGGFVYSHEPKGPIAGEVGTGFSDQLRSDMFKDPTAYTGRVARVRTTRKLPSGALFQPSLLALHEDLPMAEVKPL
jgi:DNA ligase D-like protein (predicted 3'-phosphoesterase)